MTYKVTIKNYGSSEKGKPYIVEARMNGKLVNEKKECFHSLKTARKYVAEFFSGIEVEEDIHAPKVMNKDELDAAMKWCESME